MADTPLMAGAQIQGARDYQEDSFGHWQINDQGDLLLLVADGMGGHAAGDTASQLAKDTFLAHYQQAKDGGAPASVILRDALYAANDAITQHIDENPGHEGMGCTLLAAVVADQSVTWVSVGDSPMWLLRDGQLHRLNDDHSMLPVLQGLVELGRMTEEELATDSRRNALRSALCGDQLSLVDQPDTPFPLKEGDQILLASDGVQTLAETEIATQLATHNSDPTAGVRALLGAVHDVQSPGQDNATAVVASIVSGGSAAPEPKQGSSSSMTLYAVGLVFAMAAVLWFMQPVPEPMVPATDTTPAEISDAPVSEPEADTDLTPEQDTAPADLKPLVTDPQPEQASPELMPEPEAPEAENLDEQKGADQAEAAPEKSDMAVDDDTDTKKLDEAPSPIEPKAEQEKNNE
ncbi:protein phosphatase 2C domain-containing protein [Corallincola platygyrae]|uniref:Protein phosphatase 2C domain-containing protein n=1 Tax=Corallincola platygyrae TaxID=1193278 RepID=A0ABW4XQY2_9GAMM